LSSHEYERNCGCPGLNLALDGRVGQRAQDVVGQKMTLDLVAMFDDGTPATDAIVEIYRDGELYAKNTTDGSGKFSLILPGRGTGEWRFVVSGGGHSEAYKMSIQSSNETGLAAFLAVLMIPAVWICRRGGRRT